MQRLIIIATLLISLSANARLFNPDEYSYSIEKTNQSFVVDGVLDEAAWSTLPEISTFWEHYPNDTAIASAPTKVKVTYDDENLYIAAWFSEENPQPVIQNLIRDDNGPFWRSDAFSVLIDPSNGNTNGYYFGLNAGGAKQDGFVSQQALQPSTDMYWNNAWHGEVTIDDNGYYYEMAIPFSAIKYDADVTTWGFNFIRNDMKRNLYYIWTKFESSYNGFDFNYNGEATFDDPLPRAQGKRLELKPSVSGRVERNIQDGEAVNYKLNAGLDAKYAVNENINLDVALLPDFSTVEVDKQYIDFYRYEYKVDEQREFFLENNDLFSTPGTDEDWSIVPFDAYRIKPFYTRRIGIKNWQHTPITYGARLSGNATDDLRIGVLNMQVQPYEGDLAQNYSAVGIKHAMGENSTVSGSFMNRQSVGSFDTAVEQAESDYLTYNRSAGVEMDFSNKKKSFSHGYMLHRSINAETVANANFYGFDMEYRSSMLRSKTMVNHIEDNYIVDMGYTPRLYHKDAVNDTTYRIGYTEVTNYTNLSFYRDGAFRFIQLNAKLNTYFHANDGLNEVKYQLGAYFETGKFSSVYVGSYGSRFEMLFANDVLKNDSPLPAGTYRDAGVVVNYKTSESRALKFDLQADYGKFYNGTKLNTKASAILRTQPWGVFTLSHEMFKYDLPDNNQADTYYLISGRSDINISRDITWTTLVQYNTQFDNININSLFKWRFRPLSDFYLVVKDNTDLHMNQKGYQVVAKLNYWYKI